MNLPDPAKSRAVLIGVSKYRDPSLGDRPAIQRNLHALKRQLTDPALWGLADEHCLLLDDEQLNRDTVLTVLESAIDEADDTLLVYYAGHGQLHFGERERSLYLALPGSTAGAFWRWLSYADLRHLIHSARNRVQHRIVILDCCHSGQALHHGPLSGSLPDQLAEAVSFPTDKSALLTACTATQEAWVAEDAQYSVFTGALLEVLSDGVATAGPLLRLSDVHRALPGRLGDELGGQPQLLPLNEGGDIVLGRNRGFRLDDISASRTNNVKAPTDVVLGRDTEIIGLVAMARESLAAGRTFITGIHGQGGVGKTTLARAVAQQLGEDFPEHRMEIDLYGFTHGQRRREPDELLEQLLVWTGREKLPTDAAAKAELWRAWLWERRVLLIIDNAIDVDQILPLLPMADSEACVLVTSRNAFHDSRLHHLTQLNELDEVAAGSLLRHYAQLDESVALPDNIAQWSGGLPLVLESVGNRLRHSSAAVTSQALHQVEQSRPRWWDAGAAATVGFDMSAEMLRVDLREALRSCGRHPGPDFDAQSIAAMSGCGVERAENQLGELVEASFLRQGPGRFAFHDLYGHYARLDAEQQEPAAVGPARDRLYVDLLTRAEAALGRLIGRNDHDQTPEIFDSPESARQWLTAASGELETCSAQAIAERSPSAGKLADATARWLRLDDRYRLATDVLKLLAASTAEDAQLHRRIAHDGLGDIARIQDDYPTATYHYHRALELASANSDAMGKVSAQLGLAAIARMQDDYRTATDYYYRARELAYRTGDHIGQTLAHIGLGNIAELKNDYATASEHCLQALRLAESTADLRDQANAHNSLGNIAVAQGDHTKATHHYNQAQELTKTTGNRLEHTRAETGLGKIAVIQGDHTKATHHYRRAERLAGTTGNRVGQTLAHIGLGDLARDQGDHTKATHHYRRAEELAGTTGNRVGQTLAHIGLGDLARDQGDHTTATHHYNRATELATRVGNLRGLAHVWLGFGHIYRAEHRISLAKMAFRQAQKLYNNSGGSTFAYALDDLIDGLDDD